VLAGVAATVFLIRRVRKSRHRRRRAALRVG
jgi:hypothetical protein